MWLSLCIALWSLLLIPKLSGLGFRVDLTIKDDQVILCFLDLLFWPFAHWQAQRALCAACWPLGTVCCQHDSSSRLGPLSLCHPSQAPILWWLKELVELAVGKQWHVPSPYFHELLVACRG